MNDNIGLLRYVMVMLWLSAIQMKFFHKKQQTNMHIPSCRLYVIWENLVRVFCIVNYGDVDN